MKRIGLLAGILLVLAAGAVLWTVRPSFLTAWKDKAKIAICDLRLPKAEQSVSEGDLFYVDNRPSAPDFTGDCKQIVTADGGKRLIDHANGFAVTCAADAEFDFSASPYWIGITEGDLMIRISREYSTERDPKQYSLWYFDRFMSDPDHLSENGLRLSRPVTETETGGYWFSVAGEECRSYAFIPTGTRVFYRVMFRYPQEGAERSERIERFLREFSFFRPSGRTKDTRSFAPVRKKRHSEETRRVYDAICNTDTVYWGIFTDKMTTAGIETTVPALEQQLGYRFPVVLYYHPYGDEFPLAFLQKNYEDRKIVELTLQLSGYSNEKLIGYTPQLAAYRGLEEERIRAFARGAKQFGHPFLFRLNNEMNSDWTNYSGVTVLEDPDLYCEVWKTFYRIFEEEGVDNAIWIFNPNDRDYPPANWNHFTAYFPGAEYVDLIGVTGYNTGTYYKKEKNETWREFSEIYDRIEERMAPYFSEWPWMITEFASSSIGGNKARWMKRAFREIGKYPNIKLAVWFSFADYDPQRPDEVARPYWIDETEQTLQATKEGLPKQRFLLPE